MSGFRVFRAAADEAQRLGHHWMGPEHGLLAILRGDADDTARRALEEAGLDAARFEEAYLDRLERSDPQPRRETEQQGVQPNPAWYRAEGRAEGFAHALGTGRVSSVDFLLSLLWDDREWLRVRDLDISRDTVVEGLARRGVTLPAAPLPELEKPWGNTVRVDFPSSALDAVIALLVERHPPGPGPRWGFNHDGAERAWAFAEEGIDLQALVDEAQAGPSAG